MDNKIKNNVNVSALQIAEFLRVKLYGEDIVVDNIASLESLREKTLVFSKLKIKNDILFSVQGACIITKKLPGNLNRNAFVLVDNPRLAFAKVVTHFFQESMTGGVGQNSVIAHSAVISDTTKIGNCCTIGENVIIGDFTEVRNNVVIGDGCIIGTNCLIKSNTVIGEEGFGFDFEKDGTPVRIPHIGSVIIENFVEIGALNTVARGTINNTIISSFVKTDDHVHIGHNCKIGPKTIITACSELSGGVNIGEKCWLGPNCSIMQKSRILSESLVGLGAVVIEDIPAGVVVAGNPAKILRENK